MKSRPSVWKKTRQRVNHNEHYHLRVAQRSTSPRPLSNSSTDLEAQTQNRRGIYRSRLLPTIPEGTELPHQPADPEEQRVEEDGPDHILGGRWRRVADESKRLFGTKARERILRITARAPKIRLEMSPTSGPYTQTAVGKSAG